jgi:hypothetical protein
MAQKFSEEMVKKVSKTAMARDRSAAAAGNCGYYLTRRQACSINPLEPSWSQ